MATATPTPTAIEAMTGTTTAAVRTRAALLGRASQPCAWSKRLPPVPAIAELTIIDTVRRSSGVAYGPTRLVRSGLSDVDAGSGAADNAPSGSFER
jgi:hypothetical protein